jgi:hypothetical protein
MKQAAESHPDKNKGRPREIPLKESKYDFFTFEKTIVKKTGHMQLFGPGFSPAYGRVSVAFAVFRPEQIYLLSDTGMYLQLCKP